MFKFVSSCCLGKGQQRRGRSGLCSQSASAAQRDIFIWGEGSGIRAPGTAPLTGFGEDDKFLADVLVRHHQGGEDPDVDSHLDDNFLGANIRCS